MMAFAIPSLDCDFERACVREILRENDPNNTMIAMAFACADGDLRGVTVDAVCALNCWPVGDFSEASA